MLVQPRHQTMALGPLRVTERGFNILAVVLPFAAFLVAVPLLWNDAVGWSDLAILGVMYVVSTLGITMGFHRLLTHRSYKTYPAVRYALAVLGSLAVEGPPITWVADHRKHHTFADEDGDPHSPHTHGGEGVRAVLRGLWHAHVGWLVDGRGSSEPVRYARDLLREPVMVTISRLFLPIAATGLVIPFLVGYLLTGQLSGAVTGFLWGGLVRVFLVHHMTWSVNSLGHWLGSRRFATNDRSTNVPFLALPTLGDSWHHNHHAFPTSARHGLRWWEIDVAGTLIVMMERIGLAWDVVHVNPEAMRAKEEALA